MSIPENAIEITLKAVPMGRIRAEGDGFVILPPEATR